MKTTRSPKMRGLKSNTPETSTKHILFKQLFARRKLTCAVMHTGSPVTDIC